MRESGPVRCALGEARFPESRLTEFEVLCFADNAADAQRHPESLNATQGSREDRPVSGDAYTLSYRREEPLDEVAHKILVWERKRAPPQFLSRFESESLLGFSHGLQCT